jgi:hypothetical protein
MENKKRDSTVDVVIVSPVVYLLHLQFAGTIVRIDDELPRFVGGYSLTKLRRFYINFFIFIEALIKHS